MSNISAAPTNATFPQHKPSSAPTNMDWIQHKTTIAKLYIDDDFSLHQLIIHMGQTYNFQATSNMYKKRLLAWNLRKNYRKQEKQALLAQIEKAGEHSLQGLQFHGKPVSLAKVRRFEKEQKYARAKVPVISTIMTGADDGAPPQYNSIHKQQQTTNVYHQSRMSTDTKTIYPVEQPGTIIRATADVEYMLHLLCDLYDDALMREFAWHTSYHPTTLATIQRNASRDTRSAWPPAAWVDIGLALHYLSAAQSSLSFWYLDRACQEIMSSLRPSKQDRLVEFHSLADIIDLFCDPTWDRFVDLRCHLLLYLMRLACAKEGQYHPLTLLWSLFRDRARLVACRDVLQRRLTSGFERRIGMWQISLRFHSAKRQPPQVFYGHSEWRWESRLLE